MMNEIVPFDGNIRVDTRFSAFDRFNLTTRVVRFRNQSIEDIAEECLPAGAEFTCAMSGRIVARDEWVLTFVSKNESLIFTPVLRGGDGNLGKQILGAILIIVAIVLLVATWGASSYFSFEMAYAGAAMMLAAGVGLLASAFIPMPEMPTPQDAAAASSITSWQPQTTQAQGGAVPRYYGRIKVCGNIIGANIENVGEKQYIYALICLGQGPYLGMSGFTLNDIAAADLRQTRITVRKGLLTQDILPGFEDTIINYPPASGTKLLYNIPCNVDTVGGPCDKLTIRMLFSAGLGYVTDTGALAGHTVILQVKVKRSTDATWTVIDKSKEAYEVQEIATARWELGFFMEQWTGGISFNPESVPGPMAWVTSLVGSTIPADHAEGEWAYDSYGRYCTWSWKTTYRAATAYRDYRTFSAASRNRVPVDLEYAIPPAWRYAGEPGWDGSFDICVTRMTADTDDVRCLDDVYYVGYAQTVYDDYTYPRQALVAIHALATDQLSGSLKFSCILDGAIVRVCRMVDNNEVWTIEWSDNPAWVCYDVLTSPLFSDDLTTVLRYDGVNPGRIAVADFIAWAIFCDTLLPQGRPQSVVLGTDGLKYKCIRTHTATLYNKPITGLLVNTLPKMTSATLPSGILSASGPVAPGYEVWNATNGAFAATGYFWKGEIVGPTTDVTMAYQFATAIALQAYTLRFYSGAYATDWTYEGWDGAAWVVLHTVTGFSDPGTSNRTVTDHTFIFDNPLSYIKYQFRFTAGVANRAWVTKVEMSQTGIDWNECWERTEAGDAGDWVQGQRYYFGTEKRYTFNGGFDRNSSRWDAAMQVCSAAQAAILLVGTKIHIVVDTTKTPRQLFSEGNLISFSEKFVDITNRVTEVEASFNDIDRDYDKASISVFHSDIDNGAGKLSVQVTGLVNQSEVWRICKYRVQNNLRRRPVEIEVDIDALTSTVGDVIYLQTEASEWDGGGSRGGIVMEATDNTVTIDKILAIADTTPATDYSILVRLSGTDTILTKALVTTPGDFSTFTISGTWGAVNPAFGDVYAIGIVNKVAKQFSILNVTPTEHHGASLSLLEYDPTIQTVIDSMDPEINTTTPVTTARRVEIASIVVCEEMSFDASGTCWRSLVARWTPSGAGTPYAKGRVFYRTYDATEAVSPGPWMLVGDTADVSMRIPGVSGLTSYEAAVCGIDTIGVIVSIDSTSAKKATITTIGIPTVDQIPLPAIVAGLQVKDNLVDGSYMGRDCVITWTKQEPLGANLANGGSIGGAPIVYDIVVKTSGGVALRSATVSTPEFTYPLADNTLDAAGPTFTVSVTARDAWNRTATEAASITVTNAIPANVGTIVVEAYEDGVKFAWPVSADQDLRGYKVRTRIEEAGTWSDWFENSKNTYSRDLTDAEKAAQGWGNAAVYIEVVAIDAFGQVSTAATAATGSCNNTKPSITVGPTTVSGTFTDLAAAITRLPSGGGAIVIKNGDYHMADEISLPDKHLTIYGESQGGVLVRNAPGKRLFDMRNLTKAFDFSKFTIESQNIAAFTPLIDIYGDSLSANSCDFKLKQVTILSKDDTLSSGDTAVSVGWGQIGTISLDDVKIFGGLRAISTKYGECHTGTINIGGCQLSGALEYIAYLVCGTLIFNGNPQLVAKSRGLFFQALASANVKGNTMTGTFANGITSYTGNSQTIITGNDLHSTHTPTSNQDAFSGISVVQSSRDIIDGNKIKYVSAAGAFHAGASGIIVDYFRDGSIKGNSIMIDVADNSDFHTGLALINAWAGSHRNIVEGNNIDMVRNTAKEKGISIGWGCNDNEGLNNLIYRAGVPVDDLGLRNKINTMLEAGDIDGGSW